MSNLASSKPMTREEELLRDQIAIEVLKGMHPNLIGIHRLGDVKDQKFCEQLADQAYNVAEAMVARRRWIVC